MTLGALLEAILLGVIEGLTEFIPVSSTGHILLAGHFLGFENPGRTFEVLIQLGAILAIVAVYFQKLWTVALALPYDPKARRFAAGIVIAFLPAAVLGVLLHSYIKTVLFETPMLICITLIIGGIVLLFVDRMKIEPKYFDAMQFPPLVALKIGLFQAIALIPGMSRSGSTIVGALLVGCDRRAAAEFSFFLAMPTMLGAFTYDLFKNRALLSLDDGMIIALGFIAAFCAALLVVRWVLDYVAQNGFAVFAIWRIFVGSLGLVALALLG